MPILTADDVRDHLPHVTADDARLARLAAAAEDLAARYCGYPTVAGVASMARTLYTRELTATDPRELVLDVGPVSAKTDVIGIREDADQDFTDPADDVDLDDVALVQRGSELYPTLRLVSTATRSWSQEPGTIRVTWWAGYTVPPPALVHLLGRLAAWMYDQSGVRGRQTMTTASASADSSSASYRDEDLSRALPEWAQVELAAWMLPSAVAS